MSKLLLWTKRQVTSHAFLYLVAVVFVCVACGTYLLTAKTSLLPLSLDSQFLSCMDTPRQLTMVACIHARAPGWIAQYGTAAVVAELDTYQARFGADFSCHLAGHEIGPEVLRASGGNLVKAITECSTACFSSCIHGVVIGFSASSTPKQLLAMHPEQYCAQTSSSGTEKLCMHGLGHAFMIGEAYHTALALADCDKLPVYSYLKDQCYSGVYMELSFAAAGLAHGEVATSTYYKPGDIFYPCDAPPASQNTAYARQCYLQLGSSLRATAIAQRESIFTLCAQAPAGWEGVCAESVGLLQASNDSNIPNIQRVCSEAPTLALRQQCLYGAYVYFEVGNTAAQDTTALCNALSPEERVICSSTYKIYTRAQ